MPERLAVIEQVITCTACDLHAQCSSPVAFRAPKTCATVVVGEAPGKDEDAQGQPFVGMAGQKMEELLTAAGIDPALVGFVNTVSCFPHGTPEWDHVHACADNKRAQLDLLDPTWVLLVGKVALKGTRPDLDLKHGRGRPFVHDGRVHFCTYHPAAALRNGHYEECLAEDLAVFAEMIRYVAADTTGERPYRSWTRFVPDECSACLNRAEWWEQPAGLGWCEVHMPDEGKRHFAGLARLHDEAKVRKSLGLGPDDSVIVCSR